MKEKSSASDVQADAKPSLAALKERRYEAVSSNISACSGQESRQNPPQSLDKLAEGRKRQRNLSYTLEDNARWQERCDAKNPQTSNIFVDHSTVSRRKYDLLLDKLGNSTTSDGPNRQALRDLISKERLKQTSSPRRKKFSTMDKVSYVNERNARFNEKLDRAFHNSDDLNVE